MADFGGQYVGASLYSDDPDYPERDVRIVPEAFTGHEGQRLVYGTHAENQPVNEHPEDHGGQVVEQFAMLDFYNRIHVTPQDIDLGTVLSEQVREISVWNAFFVPRTLNDVTGGSVGVILTEPVATPYAFAPLEELLYEISVDTDGPATVDASFTFDFDVIDIGVTIVGIRIVCWIWEPNWLDPVLERLAWNTDIMQSYDGSEQRYGLRGAPRVEWEFTFDVDDRKRRTFENTVYAWGGRVWALPIWTDGDFRSTSIASGTTNIVLTTEGRDFHAGGIGVVIAPDGSFEAFEIASVAVDSITLVNPLAFTWPIGSNVYPARTARLLEPRSTQRFTRNYARGLARLQTTEEIEREALSETLYRNFPVLERELNWREAPDIDYARKQIIVGFGTGRDHVTDTPDLALPIKSFRWTSLDREEADYFRAWLYARQGRLKGCWIPTWADDLILAEPLAAGALNIDVEACGLKHFALADVHRRDIRIELNDGTVFYRRCSSPVVVDASTERMTIDQATGQLVEIEDVRRISWLMFMRLDTDSIEVTWLNRGVAEAVVALKGPRNDV